MLVTFKVLSKVSFTCLNDRDLFHQANKVAPTAPTPAASVGVAIPDKMLPSTATINKIGGAICFKAVMAEVSSVCSMAGATSGFNQDTMIT